MSRLDALVHEADGRLELRSPGVGLWRGAPPKGTILQPGESLGALEILGALHPLFVPKAAHGVVVEIAEDDRARRPVDYGAILLTLDPSASVGLTAAPEAEEAARTSSGALVFPAPSSGRFYSRPAPDKDRFVEVGAVLEPGQTVGLLEVMKTFTRLTYSGEGLPERARVVAIVPDDDTDLAAGEAILLLEDV